jgi:hypothetical protein
MGAVEDTIEQVRPIFDRWIENKIGMPVGIIDITPIYKVDRVENYRTISRTVDERGCVDAEVEYDRVKVFDLQITYVWRPTVDTLQTEVYFLRNYVVTDHFRERYHECPGTMMLASVGEFEGGDSLHGITKGDHAALLASLSPTLTFHDIVDTDGGMLIASKGIPGGGPPERQTTKGD